jgi:hypothetical protein
LIGGVFWHHFLYYGKTMAIVLTPLLVLPALWSLLRRKPRSLFYMAWLAAFWIFYSFWKSGGDAWWYLRFLLPGLPGLFILAAIGLQDLADWVAARKPGWKRVPAMGAVAMLLALLPYFYSHSRRHNVISGDKGDMFFKASTSIRSLLPADALVGGLEMSGPIELYSGLRSFRWDLEESLALIADYVAKGRPLYLALEPWHRGHPAVRRIENSFQVTRMTELPGTYGMQLFRISPPRE